MGTSKSGRFPKEQRTLIHRIRKDLETLTGPPDLTPAGFLGLPGTLRQFLWWIIVERAVTCEQAAAFLGESEDQARTIVRDLDTRGLIEQVPACGYPVYRVCLEPRRLRPPEELLRALAPRPERHE
jgi:hypothetical protein